MENVEEEILKLHHSLLKDENVPNKQADCHKKSIAHFVKASFKNLNNENTSALLDNKLKTYSNIAHNTQESIYEDKLKLLLSTTKNITGNNFKSNLNTINAKQYIKPLPCTSGKTYCMQSENIGEELFDEFQDIFKDLKRSTATKISQIQSTKIISKQPESSSSNSNTTSIKRTSKDSSGTGIFDNCFKTAREELEVQSLKNKYGNVQQSTGESSAVLQKRGPSKLGTRRSVGGKFVPPIKSHSGSNEDIKNEIVDERLKNIEPKMVELIKSEIMDCSTSLHWNDIAGLTFAKTAIQEAVVWPMLRPDIFTGLRKPPKGILLFGPPGTGKTLIGKCVASQSKSTFFSISASSLTSKWVGDGEKMVRALFAVARVHQPSVIFIDEVDSLLSQRSDTEHESSRRIKTEFLVQLDGATTDSEERLLVIGATNRPQELDEAARRRFVKRLYIPLPEYDARLQLLQKLICNENHQLEDGDFEKISSLSDGFSGADIKNLCSEASLGPIRSIDFNLIEHIQASDVRPLLMEDFAKALTRVKSSVAPKDLEQYISWDNIYGSGF